MVSLTVLGIFFLFRQCLARGMEARPRDIVMDDAHGQAVKIADGRHFEMIINFIGAFFAILNDAGVSKY